MVVDGLRRGIKPVRMRTRLSEEANKAIRMLLITLTIFIVVLSGSYFVLKSKSAQQSYRLSQVQEQNNDLTNTKQGLDAKLIEVLSLTQIGANKQVKDMATPESTEYITKKKKNG